mmetsp:Transcript_21014/g.59653  ORF Transcript_21014/g.59653 Transcript_21014/m.59653 type:complete len:413 (-) Transcript_21014:14-1252(-)
MWLRIVDGLFLGGEQAACDRESAVDSKVSRVINCCGRQIGNTWEHMGVAYLTYNWEDHPSQTILDGGDFVANETYDFIEEALDRADGVLIHSFFGQSRSCVVLLAYLMKKFRWSLQKALEFLDSRQLELGMNEEFAEQLHAYEERLTKALGPLSSSWDEMPLSPDLGSEVLLLRNTYVNVRDGVATASPSSPSRPSRPPSERKSIVWADNGSGSTMLLVDPFSEEEWREARAKAGDTPRPAAKPALRGAAARQASSDDRPQPQSGDAGAASGAEAAQGGSSDQETTIAIKTQAGIIRCRPEDIVCKRFGLKFKRGAIIVEYMVPAHNLRAHHIVLVEPPEPAESLSGGGDSKQEGAVAVENLDTELAARLQRLHAPWLATTSTEQLAGLVARLRLAGAIGGRTERDSRRQVE